MKKEEQPAVSAPDVEPTSQPGVPQQPEETEMTTDSQVPVPPPQAVVPKKSKKGLIIGIVSASVAVLLLVVGVLVYFLWYQNPERVLMSAIVKMQSSKQVATSTVVTSDFEYSQGGAAFKFKHLKVDFGSEVAPKFDTNAELTFEVDGKEYTLKSSALLTDSGDVYFKMTNIKKVLADALASFGTEPSDKALAYLDKIDDKWVKTGISDLKKANEESGETAQCMLDALKKNLNDKAYTQQATTNYQNHPFISVRESVQSKDGNVGYKVSIDKEKFKAYTEADKDTSLQKDLRNCNSSTYSSSTQDSQVDRFVEEINKSNITVWVSRWSHDLKGVDVETSLGESDGKYTVKTETTIDTKKGVKTDVPTDALSLEDFTEAFQGFFSEVNQSYYDQL